MAVMNFGVCLVLMLYQLSAAYSDEASSESADLGLTGKIVNPLFKKFRTFEPCKTNYLHPARRTI